MHPRASPRSILAGYLVATALLASSFGAIAMLPVQALIQFQAAPWQTTLITAAISTLMIATIFWGEYLRRLPLRTYLAVYWLCTFVPLAAIAGAESYWQLLACYLVHAVGFAGWYPVEGKLLSVLFAERSRGRTMGAITAARLAAGMLSAFAVGAWLQADPEAFRIYLPIIALLEFAGLALVLRIAAPRIQHSTGAGLGAGAALRSWREKVGDERGRGEARALFELLRPVLHMREILRDDWRFYRYERAFMTYGVGWMICFALLPIFVTRQLGMSYAQVANSTQVVLQCAMLAVAFPVGWVNDRLGPVRTSALAFALLSAYPIGLMLSRGVFDVAVITVLYGVALSGVQMGWMLGPIALAGHPERVPQYVAIHATLVGVRAIVGQGIGTLLYVLTGSVIWSLAAAAIVFATAAVQMWRLHTSIAPARSASPEPTRTQQIEVVETGSLATNRGAP